MLLQAVALGTLKTQKDIGEELGRLVGKMFVLHVQWWFDPTIGVVIL